MEYPEGFSLNVDLNDDKFNLQLAAELGKTLLERNQELEETVRRLQTIIEEQSREIEYLTKQTCQLRDANEARLRIYETLEQSVGELERHNRLLQDETRGDKKRIKALCASLELVEQHCEELQEEVDIVKSSYNAPQYTPQLSNQNKKSNSNGNNAVSSTTSNGKNKKRNSRHSDYTSSEESITDEDSGIHGDESDFAGFEDTPLELQEVLRLRSDLARLRSQISREQRMRESLSCELERSVQENSRLREELLSSRERERYSLNLQMDMGGVHGLDLSNNMCSNCRLMDGPEEELCELDSGMNSAAEAEVEAGDQEPENSLMNELDMQYRVLIEKYEALLEARRRDFDDVMTTSQMSSTSQTFESGFSDTASSPTPPVITTEKHDAACQTDIQVLRKRPSVDKQATTTQPRSSSRIPPITPALTTNLPSTKATSMQSDYLQVFTPTAMSKLSDADQATFDKHFENSPPEYKKLFAEIFAVLKRKVAEMPVCSVASSPSPNHHHGSSMPLYPDLESRLESNLEKLKAVVPPHIRFTRSYAEVVRNRQQQAHAQTQQAKSAYSRRFAR